MPLTGTAALSPQLTAASGGPGGANFFNVFQEKLEIPAWRILNAAFSFEGFGLFVCLLSCKPLSQTKPVCTWPVGVWASGSGPLMEANRKGRTRKPGQGPGR